jgi:NAD(P)-dependent dehydrogenase (short-subunit alcohol dehydrogenase family)
MTDLAGAVALVTGGAKRVGRAIVIELARAGCDVVIHYRRSKTEADSACDQLRSLGRRALAVAADLDDPRTWESLIRDSAAWLGRLDVLVNNASVFQVGSADRIDAAGFDPELWGSVVRVNLTAPVALCYHAQKFLAERGRGRIVNLCDIAAERPWAGHLAYCASKAGLVAATKALAKALAPRITVNGVSPGIAVFPDEYSDQLRQRLVEQVPLRRAGTPEEVARLVRFLVESGDYLTGEIISIDGGRSLV